MSTPQRLRRIRRVRPEPTAQQARLDALLQSVAKHESEIARLKTQVAQESAEALALMQALRLDTRAAGAAFAEIVRPAGRASNVIDPIAFRQAVEDDKAFYAAITVSVQAAKQVLSGKELARITKTVPGKPGEPTLKVTTK